MLTVNNLYIAVQDKTFSFGLLVAYVLPGFIFLAGIAPLVPPVAQWLNRTGEDKNLEDNFVKELGFSLCNKLTPYLFMQAAERPPNALIHQAATAIKYRNEIMHALRNSSGVYRIRTRTNGDLSNAYTAVLQLYDYYRKAFERALALEQSTPSARLAAPQDG